MPLFVVIARDPLILEEGVAGRMPPGIPVERRYAASLQFDDIFNELGSRDLFATVKAFHYVNFLDLKLGKKEEARFLELLGRLEPETTLACSQLIREESWTKEQQKLKRADFKRIAKLAVVDDLMQVSAGERAVDWLADRGRSRYGLALNNNQVRRLLAASGDSVALADSELKKLSLFKTSDKLQPIPDSLLATTLSDNPAARFFELVELILAGRPEALKALRDWFSLEPKAGKLVNELQRRLLGLKALREGEEVYPQFFKRQLKAVERHFPMPRLAKAVESTAALEHGLKSGLVPGETSDDADLAALEVYTAQMIEGSR